jgi:hypothetical protein
MRLAVPFAARRLNAETHASLFDEPVVTPGQQVPAEVTEALTSQSGTDHEPRPVEATAVSWAAAAPP